MGVNAFWFTPTILALLLRGDRGTVGMEYCRETVRFAFVGTAPLAARTRQEFEARYGVKFRGQRLSQTLFVSTRAAHVPASPESVGLPVAGVEVRVGEPDARQLTGLG